MHPTLWSIKTKPNDYKVCTKCGMFKWYERDTPCNYCGGKNFYPIGVKVAQKAHEMIESYVKEDGYTESEAEDIETDAG